MAEILARIDGDVTLQGIIGEQAMDQLKYDVKGRASLQTLIGNQALEQIEAKGLVDKDLQDMINSGDMAQLMERIKGDVTLQGIIGTQAIEQIEAKGNSQLALEDAVGKNAMDRLREQGTIDTSLQELINSGDMAEIAARIAGDVTLQGMVGEQAIAQINEKADRQEQLQSIISQDELDAIGAKGYVDAVILQQKIAGDTALQNLIGDQRISEIGAQAYTQRLLDIGVSQDRINEINTEYQWREDMAMDEYEFKERMLGLELDHAELLNNADSETQIVLQEMRDTAAKLMNKDDNVADFYQAYLTSIANIDGGYKGKALQAQLTTIAAEFDNGLDFMFGASETLGDDGDTSNDFDWRRLIGRPSGE
jgi:hypothetical protein